MWLETTTNPLNSREPRTAQQRRESVSITYGRPAQETVPFPRELAVLIVKKACRMAEKFENECIDTMQRDTRRALQRGTDPAVIVRQLGL